MRILKSKLLEGLEMQKRALVEESFAALHTMNSKARQDRAKSIPVFYEGVYQDSSTGHAITNWRVPSEKDKAKKYGCNVGIIVDGGLFKAANEKWDAKRFANLFSDADVQVYCNCPDFFWGGAKYNLGKQGKFSKSHTFSKSAGYSGRQNGKIYREEDDVTHAPDVRDPNREHFLCKHLEAVFTRFRTNALSIMKDAKNYESPQPISLDQNAAMLDRDNPEQEQIRNQLMEDFTDGVLNKDRDLSEDEREDIIDTTMDTSDENIEQSENDVIDDVEITPEEREEPEVEVNEIIEPESVEEEQIETDVNDLTSTDNEEQEDDENYINPGEIIHG